MFNTTATTDTTAKGLFVSGRGDFNIGDFDGERIQFSNSTGVFVVSSSNFMMGSTGSALDPCLQLYKARALSCASVVEDAMDEIHAAVTHGHEAAMLFRSMDEDEKEYQTLANTYIAKITQINWVWKKSIIIDSIKIIRIIKK